MADLCVIIARRRHNKVLEDMATAGQQGARLLEIRLDYLNRPPRLMDIVQNRPCPLIATVRRREDGGQWRDSEDRRQRLLRAAIAAGFDYVDLESDIAHEIPRFGETKRIISYHDMHGMPEDLFGLHAELLRADADIVKIAGRAERPVDNFEMFRLLQSTDVPTIALCMGEYGLPSRVLGPKFGSPYTYAMFNDLRVVAPGLLTREQLMEVYRYPTIDRDTEVYGVVGYPIAQSLSPLVHNSAFGHYGMNKVYVPFLVPSDSLDSFLREMDTVPIRGLSVTIPHKEAMLRYGEPSDPLVTLSGSSNTVVVKGKKRKLYNTDGPAALSALEEAIPADPDTGEKSLAMKTVLILGAGGVARTIAHGLRQKDAIISIANRDARRAHKLAAEVGCTVLEWSQRHSRHFDVLINCTPVGMFPDVQECPIHPSALTENMVVFDTIYNPENTALIHSAKERGCIVISGVDMFVRQAEAQFKIYTGKEAPSGLMGTLVREELSPARKMLREVRLGLQTEK